MLVAVFTPSFHDSSLSISDLSEQLNFLPFYNHLGTFGSGPKPFNFQGGSILYLVTGVNNESMGEKIETEKNQ